MSARPSAAVERAVRYAQNGHTISAAARRFGVAVSSVRRALRKLGEPPRSHPGGPEHHNYQAH